MKRKRSPSKATICALTTLLEAPAGLHGYEITQTTGIGPGTLYPMLARLEDQQLLASEWEAAQERGRPPRRVYSLTNAGTIFARKLCKETPKSQQSNSQIPKPT